MVTDQEGAGTDTPTSRACASGASTGVVPHATGDSSTHPTPDPLEEGSDSIHTPRRPPRGKAPSGCVGYLWQWYRDCQISEGATKLLLASWRQKSSKTYHSLLESG